LNNADPQNGLHRLSKADYSPALKPVDTMKHSISVLTMTLLALILHAQPTKAEAYPIIAYGTRTYVAETTDTGGTILVRVYRRTGSASWHRYGGFTLASGQLAARRAAVRRNPESASAPERVYFAGTVIGTTHFRPSSPLYHDRDSQPRIRIKRK
jgi:hypothetical protein